MAVLTALVSPVIIRCEAFPEEKRQQAESRGRTGEYTALVGVD